MAGREGGGDLVWRRCSSVLREVRSVLRSESSVSILVRTVLNSFAMVRRLSLKTSVRVLEVSMFKELSSVFVMGCE